MNYDLASKDITYQVTEPAKSTEQIKNLNVCSYCQYKVELIWVHGHYQCPRCKNVVVSCCEII